MARETNSEFVPSLQSFRSTGEDYFYEYDGHLNPEGSLLVSNLLQEYLVTGSDDQATVSRGGFRHYLDPRHSPRAYENELIGTE